MASKIDSKNQSNPEHARQNSSISTNSSTINPTDNRFGRKSRSMFFIRHTAHPKNLRFITGVGGIQVCAMKEDNYNLPDSILEQIKSSTLAAASNNSSILSNQKSIENYIGDPKYALKFDSNNNQDLLKKYEKKVIARNRKERILPPIKHWTSTYMLADDTKRWRSELNNLAKKVGILTSEEADSDLTLQNSTGQARKQNDQIKIDSLEIKNVKSLEFQRANTMVNMSVNTNKPNAGITRKKLVQDEIGLAKEERIKTGRFNEPRGSALGTRKSTSSRLRTSLNLNPNKSKFILCTEESEREMWLLQILCQILNTESMQEIQSWLVSSGLQEKEAMKELIQKALDGLNQSGRIDLEKLNINPNDKTTQVDFEQIKNSITSLIENNKNIQYSNNNTTTNNNNNNSIIINNNNMNNGISNATNNSNNETKAEEVNSNTINNNVNSNNNNQSNSQNNNINNYISSNSNNNNNLDSLMNADNLIMRIKLEQANKENETEENPFASGSEFKSVSLINMDPYKFERAKTLSTFEHYLSRSTYFQSKARTRALEELKNYNSTINRPFTCNEAKKDFAALSLETLNNTLSKKILNKFNRIELVDLKRYKDLISKDETEPSGPKIIPNLMIPKNTTNNNINNSTNIHTTTTTTSTTNNNNNNNYINSNSNNNSVTNALNSIIKNISNVKAQTKKSDDSQAVLNPSNVKLKLETNKDTQVLTIEDN